MSPLLHACAKRALLLLAGLAGLLAIAGGYLLNVLALELAWRALGLTWPTATLFGAPVATVLAAAVAAAPLAAALGWRRLVSWLTLNQAS
jgi:hypothetical protein